MRFAQLNRNSYWQTGLLVLVLGGAVLGAAVCAEEPTMLSPVDFTAVRLDDAFWKPRLEVLRDKTLPHVFEWCEKTHRLANFDSAAGQGDRKHEGYFFNDSDVYKALEGAAYLLALFPDAQRQQQADAWIDRIAAAQQPDGYLNTYFQVAKPGQRWTDDSKHELYCAGHLVEAGIAYFRATGKRTLLDVAIRYIDYIDSVFGPGKRAEAPEHPEIELALVKLWQETGEQRYLKLARFFLDCRGQPRGRPAWGEYAQDDKPIREQTEVRGHAVRAMYLYSAVTDVAGLAGATDYVPTLDRLWQDLISRKMYITGGIGVSAENEGFTSGYDLPNEHAYAETCASIGLALWSYRMSRLERDARFFDVFERVVYNGALSGLSASGDRFLYANPLLSRGPAGFKTGGGKQGESTCHRQEWFACACCPPNLLRFFPTIGGYVYTRSDDAIYVNLYMASRAEIKLRDRKVTLTQRTNYPWDGRVEIHVAPEPPGEFDLNLRVPAWCFATSLSANGGDLSSSEMQGHYRHISRHWQKSDVITLELQMPIVRIECNPRVKDDVGRLAIQRGPLVYCLEDGDGGGVLDLAIPRNASLTAEWRPELLGGVTLIAGTAERRALEETEVPAGMPPLKEMRERTFDPWGNNLYRRALASQDVKFTAIPYYAWDNRAPGAMVVWIPESLAASWVPPTQTAPAKP